MPYACAAVGCSNRSTDGSLRFHHFPGENRKHMRERWIAAVNRKDFVPTRYTVLCSKHFTADCYERNVDLLGDFGLSVKSARLNKNAVPTIFARRRPAPKKTKGAVPKKRTKDVSPGTANSF